MEENKFENIQEQPQEQSAESAKSAPEIPAQPEKVKFNWDYSAQDYPTTMAFLRQAREMNIPIKELITHSFPLDQLNEAMEVNISQKGIKICYVPN